MSVNNFIESEYRQDIGVNRSRHLIRLTNTGGDENLDPYLCLPIHCIELPKTLRLSRLYERSYIGSNGWYVGRDTVIKIQ